MADVLVFVIGMVFGSFMNVCIFRIPAGESVLTGRSHCTVCKTDIKWYDLVPVLSYIILGGRCRNCKIRISARYPFVEFLNGASWFILYKLLGFNLLFILICITFSTLLVLILIAYDNKKHESCKMHENNKEK